VSVQPQNIGSPARFVGIGVPNAVPENLPIAERPTTPLPIAGQVHSAGRVIVVKGVVRASLRSGFGVITAIEEF